MPRKLRHGRSSNTTFQAPNAFCLATVEALELRAFLSAVTQLRIATYNIAADIYSQNDTTAPQPAMETVLEGIGSESVNGIARPLDILALQETAGNSTTIAPIIAQLNSHYGAGTYSQSSYQALASGDTDGNGPSGLVYNTHTLTLVATSAVGFPDSSGPPRQPVRYEFRPVGGSPSDDFYVYNSHYKSGDEYTDNNGQRRQREAQSIRANAATLPANARILYVGDYNIYSATELGYQAITAAGPNQAFDPINSPHFHDSQTPLATRSFSPSSLSSRLDLQLSTYNVLNDGGALHYLSGSYHVFGNNGSSSNVANSTALAGLPNRTAVLNALVTTSDHLPVVADYSVSVDAPTIASLATNPQSVAPGGTVTLTANNVSGVDGATVQSVQFYRETNGVSGLQPGSDALVGSGASNGSTWTANTSTTGFAAGTQTYYAVATDNFNTTSRPVSTTLSVVVPTVGSFAINPTTVTVGASATLTATNVTGKTVGGVNFYRESNGTAGLQIGSDTFVGSGTQNGSNWNASTSTTGLTPGNYSYYAVATDTGSNAGPAVSASLSVTALSQPLFNISILASTNPKGPYTDSLTVSQGQQYYFEVVGQLAPVGTSNTQGTTTRTITSEVDGIDGVNSLSFNLAATGGSVGVNFSTAALASPSTTPASQRDWNGTAGATAGVLTSNGTINNQILAARPIHSAGTQTGVSQDVIEFGSFTIPSATVNSTTQIAGTFAGTLSALRINGGIAVSVNSTTESSTSPIFSFKPLSLTATSSLPPWLASGSQATYDAASKTLSVTGPTTIVADPGADAPIINASGAAAVVTVAPTGSDRILHLGGVNLAGGASLVASVLGSRSHANHLALVLGTAGGAAPTFSVDSSSKLDLGSNDLIVHNGSLSAVQALADTGRNAPAGSDGNWNGKGLTSSVAASADSSAGYEQTLLAVARNGDLFAGSYGSWSLGSQSETLSSSDILVKYTYNGDFTLDGKVDGDDDAVKGVFYSPSTTGQSFATGDTNRDGRVDDTDDGAFGGLFYGNGTLGQML